MRTANRQIFRIAPALLVLAIALLQPAPEAFADVSVQDKEVLEAVEKVAPTIEEIGKKLWGLSEVSLLEIKSSAYLKDLFKKSGFTMALLDGYNMYTTGNFFPIAGGFNNAGMEPFTA